MSPGAHNLDDAHTGFPRVSGDEPWSVVSTRPSTWFSPRERG